MKSVTIKLEDIHSASAVVTNAVEAASCIAGVVQQIAEVIHNVHMVSRLCQVSGSCDHMLSHTPS